MPDKALYKVDVPQAVAKEFNAADSGKNLRLAQAIRASIPKKT